MRSPAAIRSRAISPPWRIRSAASLESLAGRPSRATETTSAMRRPSPERMIGSIAPIIGDNLRTGDVPPAAYEIVSLAMVAAHTDVVGSLLRPPELLEARRLLETGEISEAEFKRVEDAAVDAAVALQEQAGIEVV